MMQLKRRIASRALSAMSRRHIFKLLNQAARLAGDHIHESNHTQNV
jgi:hypothetical protein